MKIYAFNMDLAYLIVLLIVLNSTESKVVRHRAAVVTNGVECSEMASNILREGGSAADAAITGLLCEGVTSPQGAGIGGGFVMTIFTAATGKVEALNAREMAPSGASKDMFKNDAVQGGKAVGVPGEIKGYWELHQKYGKLKWARMFEPVIELCRRGHLVTPYFAIILRVNKEAIMKSPSLAEIYINPATNDVYQKGDYVKRLKLADTLQEIADKGAATLYENGKLAKLLIEDIQRDGGIMTVKDLMNYRVRWQKPISQKLESNKTLHTFSLPGSGSIIVFIMNILNNYLPNGPVLQSYQRIIESFKYAYAQRSHLGDSEEGAEVVRNLTSIDFAMQVRNELDDERTYNDSKHYGAEFETMNDHGTAHMNVLAPNGDAIAVTSSINGFFGSKLRSNQTGIILNDSMNDFAVPGHVDVNGLPAAPSNFIAPFKRPLSSMSPTILLDEDGKVELLIGSAGGARITTSISYVLLRYLYFNETLWDAAHAPRIHHQLLPMQLVYENGFPEELVQGLKGLGHDVVENSGESGFASVTAIGRDGNNLVAINDPIRQGSSQVF